MKKRWRWNNETVERSDLDSILDKVVRDLFARGDRPKHRRSGAARPPAKRRRQSFALEAIEPRLLLSADLTYGNPTSVPGDITNPGQISTYISSLTSTTFVLKAEQSGSDLFWNLYGTGLTGTDPETLVLQKQITSASDLDVNIKRDDFGAHNDKISLIDFVGDRLTVNMDSLSALNAQFGGTAIDIDFAGGKDIDIGNLIGIPLPAFLGNDQVVLKGDGGSFSGHDFKLHSSSDIVNDNTGLQITASGLVEISSDSKVVIDQGSAISASNITLKADSSSTGGLFQGLLADASSAVTLGSDTLGGATLTAMGGTVKLLAHSDVTLPKAATPISATTSPAQPCSASAARWSMLRATQRSVPITPISRRPLKMT